MRRKSSIYNFIAATALAASCGAWAQSAPNQAEIEKQFQQAMDRRANGEFEEAIRDFQSILSNQPTLNRARLELAVAYFQSLNFAQARAEAEKVLNDPSTPPNVKFNTQRFLEAIARESQPHVFTPSISVGYGHDSNINVGPGSDTVTVGGASLTLVPGSTRLASDYTQVNMGLAHRYLSPSTVSIGGRSASFLWQSSLNYLGNYYQKVGTYDLDVFSLATGPALVIANRWRGNLIFQMDDISLGHSRVAKYSGVSPSSTWVLGRTEITVDAQVQDRRFVSEVNRGRDSTYGNIGVSVGHLFSDDKFAMQGGVRSFDERAGDARFGNKGEEYFVGASYRLMQETLLFARVSERNATYRAIDPTFGVLRDDTEQRIALGASHKFAEGMLSKWVLGVNLVRTTNRSSVAVYSYDRDQIGATLSRSF